MTRGPWDIAGYRQIMRFTFRSEAWQYPGQAAWVFVSLPQDISKHIEQLTHQERRGFGSVRVEAQLGETSWNTSIFPDNKRGCYLLPLKKAVRATEHIELGAPLTLELTVLDI
jgi:hypothetical protein